APREFRSDLLRPLETKIEVDDAKNDYVIACLWLRAAGKHRGLRRRRRRFESALDHLFEILRQVSGNINQRKIVRIQIALARERRRQKPLYELQLPAESPPEHQKIRLVDRQHDAPGALRAVQL